MEWTKLANFMHASLSSLSPKRPEKRPEAAEDLTGLLFLVLAHGSVVLCVVHNKAAAFARKKGFLPSIFSAASEAASIYVYRRAFIHQSEAMM